MNRDPLREALRSLPRHRASMGFTRRVVERLDDSQLPASRSWLPRWAVATAALAALALAVVPWLLDSRPAPRQSAASDVELLRQERQRVLSEIERLRQRSAPTLPVVYLGGDDNVDLVLDLEELLRRKGQVQARGASYQPAGSF